MRIPTAPLSASAACLACMRDRRRPGCKNPLKPQHYLPRQSRTSFFTSASAQKESTQKAPTRQSITGALLFTGLFMWWLYPSEEFEQLSEAREALRKKRQEERERRKKNKQNGGGDGHDGGGGNDTSDSGSLTVWMNLSSSFETFSADAGNEWSCLSMGIVDMILPDWSKLVPGYVRKLSRELSMAPGSLADEIWREAHDELVNPEIRYSATVRVSNELCNEEREFLARRRMVTKVALAKYLDMDEKDIHPDDVPVIAMCGSGGGLRALVAGTGSLLAAEQDGLFDCVTYTSGVSGSCWLQALYFSSIAGCSLYRVLEHLKTRTSIHMAYPPVAFQSLVSAPTNKYLLSGLVEKLRGDPHATFGLVDIYGLLLAARYLVPKGELGVNDRDLKLSNQRQYIKYGQNPLPIYTAVRHEIPGMDNPTGPTQTAKEIAKKEDWFQWFEITPYEFFCEEFSAGIPTWALGRRFEDGVDVPPEEGFHMPEVRLPFLMGVFGSAFCATLSHYYREIRPLVRSVTGFGALDSVISQRYNDDLSKVHPIDPGTVANFIHGMHGRLPDTVPEGVYDSEYIQLMDAGMSNNLPIYPLLRPGRGVEIAVVFDASADIRTDNWLSVTDGYAKQRGIKGWPVGIGWPKPGESPADIGKELDEADHLSAKEAEGRLLEAKQEQQDAGGKQGDVWAPHDAAQAAKFSPGDPSTGDLGYCTVWVGTTQERSSAPPPPSKAVSDSTSWQLMEPDAGIAVVYMPFLANPDKVPNVNPGTSDYLSTWNFVYTPEQVDQVAALARANYQEGRTQIRETVKAVYLRKKKVREEREAAAKQERYGALVRRGMGTRLGEGDHFS